MIAATTDVTHGAGIYFDGRTSARQDVRVELGKASLRIAAPSGLPLSEWPYDEIVGLPAPANVLRLGRRGSATLERLEILDVALAAAIDARAAYVDRDGLRQRRQRLSVVGWSVAATASLVLVAWFGVPALAGRIAPLVPGAVERKLGNAVAMQVRGVLDTKHAGAGFECGGAGGERPGRAALDKVVHRLESVAVLPLPLQVFVVRRDEANAIALPGAQLYVFRGLIAKADSPDELAGVIAHEIGHVAHRDGTRSMLQAGGLSLLFGMLLGDFMGGGAIVIAAKAVLQSSYSRNVEAAADLYGAELMARAGGNPRALGVILGRIGGATEPGMTILLDHPQTAARVAAVNRVAPPPAVTPFLNAAEWSALKRVCAG
jgi:Zn-dependent protease with chaperone function